MTGASFGYDGLGRRLQMTVGGSTTDFLYDGINPVQELSAQIPHRRARRSPPYHYQRNRAEEGLSGRHRQGSFWGSTQW